MNIKLNYLYRDFSNYKKFGSIIISNPNNLPFQIIKSSIKEYLIEGEYFNADQLKLPSLFFEDKNEDDHEWHEFESLELTNHLPEVDFTILDLISKLKNAVTQAAAG